MKAVLAHMWVGRAKQSHADCRGAGTRRGAAGELSLRLKAFAASLTLEVFYVFRHKEVATDSVDGGACH